MKGKGLFTLSPLLFAFLAGAATVDVTAGNFGSCRTLVNGNTYRFAENVTFAANAGESAMTVAGGASVVIEIPAGVTVTLWGGKANGQVGAGAGIEVPPDATLVVRGAGTLNATGGAAANGEVGWKGNDAEIWDESSWNTTSGSGGDGGTGGGGAGAGIGGKGGNGGYGGTGGSGVSDNWSGTYVQSGRTGSRGRDGDWGLTCGTLEIRGTVTVTAKGGASALAGGSGGFPSDWRVAEGSTWFGAGYGGGGGRACPRHIFNRQAYGKCGDCRHKADYLYKQNRLRNGK